MAYEWTRVGNPALPQGLYVETYGEGTPIVFIAGNGGGTSFWYGLAPLIAKGFKLIAMDYRDAPMRDDTGGLFETAVRKANDVPKLLDALGIAKAIVLGHSTGAQAAARLAAANPERLLQLVFSGGYAAPHPFIEESMSLRKAILEQVGPDGFMLDSLFRAVPPAHLFKQLADEGADKILSFRKSPDIEIEGARIDQIRTGDVSALLPTISLPTAVLHARDDSVFPYPLGEAVAAAIPGASLSAVESGGHLGPMLAPNIYAQTLLGVLTT